MLILNKSLPVGLGPPRAVGGLPPPPPPASRREERRGEEWSREEGGGDEEGENEIDLVQCTKGN